MKYAFLLVAFLTTQIVLAQDWGTASGNSIGAFEAGYTNFRPYQLNDKFRAAGADTTLTMFETYGIAHVGTLLISRGGTFDAAFALHYFRPVSIALDSQQYKFSGWEFMTSIYGFEVLPKIRAVDFVVAPGVFWGNIKMRKYFSGGNPKQYELFKNPFVAPMLRADLRFNLGPITLGGRWSYRYDITKPKWKKGSSETLPGYKMHEMQYIVYIGWRFNWKEK